MATILPRWSARERTRSSPRAMAKAGGLHFVGLLVLLAGAFLPIADFFIVNVALPTISRSLDASPATLELIVAGYGTAYAATLVLGGRLGDRYGRHRLFLVGLIAFILASLACGLSPTIWVLIAARIVQGISAALIVPQVLATAHATLEGERKARALALYGATSGIAAVVGQLAGGLLVTANIAGTSWRPIFLINIPIGLVVIVLASQLVPATRAAHPAGIDLPGTLLFAGALVALLVPLTLGQKLGWPTWTWVLLALAVVFAIGAFRVERRTEERGGVPLLPPSVLRLRSMWRGLAMLLPYSMGFGAFMFVFALTVQDGLGFNALWSGLAILPMVVLFFIGSVVSPRLISRYGRGALAGGASVQAIGLALIIAVMWRAWPHVTMVDLAGPLALIGAGQSLLFAGLFRVVMTDVPAHHSGIGSGVLITLQQTGLALGVATLGTLYVALAPYSISHAFAAAIGIQLAITVLLILSSRSLPLFTAVQTNDVVAEL
jgi:predicted MFS family arabinose efflux permease